MMNCPVWEKMVGQHLNTISSKLKTGAPLRVRNQSKVARGLCAAHVPVEKLKGKKKAYKMWKKGLATWEEYRNAVRACRDETRKARAHLELKLEKEVKDNKKSFLKYGNSKRKPRENAGPLLNEVGALVTGDAEKVEILDAFFASVFTAKTAPWESQIWR